MHTKYTNMVDIKASLTTHMYVKLCSMYIYVYANKTPSWAFGLDQHTIQRCSIKSWFGIVYMFASH